MVEVKKDYIAEEDLSVYTIELDDGSSIVLNEYEIKELKAKLGGI